MAKKNKLSYIYKLKRLYQEEISLTKIQHLYISFKSLIEPFLAAFFLLLSFPLWPMIISWIKLDSPGPIFFRHRRVGIKGKTFIMYKFRSMYQGVNPDALTPVVPHDSRITPIGRIIRRFCIDEIPQLINILKGEMSLVGPRPEMLFIVNRYSELEEKRLLVKPGLTGLWQIMGRKDKPIHDDLILDLYYLKHYSFSWDLFIIFQTLPFLFFPKVIW